MNKLLINIIFCSFTFLFTLNAQINNRPFYSINSDSDQDRQAFSITESTDGFIWFVNEEGVCRYDGNQIKNYKIKIGWKAFLKKNANGDLLLCTATGIGYKYNELTDSFDILFGSSNESTDQVPSKNKKHTDNNKTDFKPSYVGSMEVDQWGRIWISTNVGLVCFDPVSKEWLNLDAKELKISCLLIVKDQLYIFGKNKITALKLIKANQKNEKPATVVNLSTNDNIISAYWDASNENIYLGTFNKGLFRLNKKKEVKQLISITNSPIRCIKRYNKETILVGADGRGIYEFNVTSEKVVACQRYDENNVNALGSNGIYDIYVDNNKRIWAATYSKGVNVYDPNQIHFKKEAHLIGVSNSLANNYVNAILEDSKKNLWFATNNGISIKNSVNGNWTHLLTNNSDKNSDNNSVVMSLCNDSKGQVWSGGYGFGIKIINPNNLSIQSIDLFKLSNESVNNYIFSIINQNQFIWGSGVSNKLFSLNLENGTLNKFPIDNIRGITIIDENHFVLMGYSQLLLFDKVTGKIDLALDKLINSKLKRVEYLCVKRNGDDLWIGTYHSGVIRYSFKTKKIQFYNTSNGLPSNSVVSLEIDKNNCVWMGTNEGLCRLNPKSSYIIPFKTQDQSDKGTFNYNASLELRNGIMVFGTKRGAISFDPNGFLVSPKRGALVWTNFNLFNIDEDTREISQILNKGLNKSEIIELHYDENSFNIGFQELNYNQSIKTRYSTCLKGYRKEFSPLSTENSASFYNIPPGDYQLVVRSYFADENGKYIERSIQIYIQQPWWNRIWAWCIWIILIGFIVYGIYRYFKNRIELQYSDEKKRFFINVSHDMRTPITLIKAPLGDLIHDTSLSPSSKYLVNTINNNVNRLFEMINRILDFEKSDEQEMRLFPKAYELNQYIQDIVENFYSYAEAKGIEIEKEIALENTKVYFDRIKMDMVIENLVSNAIKYTKQGGNVKIAGGADKNCWWIEVKDNGIGIPPVEQKKIFKRFFRAENAINSKQIGSGMGLLLVNNLVKIMGGEISFESEVNIKTVFRIKFPRTTMDVEVMETEVLTSTSNELNISKIKSSDNELPSVLFVDDNGEILNYISNRLSTDYRIYTAQSAAEAIKILETDQISIIVSDNMMPDVSGIEFCEKLKADTNYCHIPFVLLSALSGKNDILKGLQIGADDYITKPFDSLFLKQRIDNILDNRKRLEHYFQTSNGDVSELSKQDFVNELDKLFLDKLEKTFEANISNPEYTIESLCRDIGMSRTVLYNRLKNLMNLSTNEFMRMRRMEKAEELLKSQKYSVIEVSEMVGYTDVKYFSSFFAKTYGISPSKFLKNPS